MTTILFISRGLWRIYLAFVFCTTFILLYPAFFVLLSNENWYKYAFKLKRFVSIVTITLTGIRVVAEKNFELEPNTPVVICPNHQSMLDIMLIYCYFPHYFVFMGKQQLRNVPLFGIFFKDMDIGVDRSSRTASHKAWLRAAEDLDKNRPVVMFPEGTISPKAPDLLAFKNGPFKLAIEKQVPILPVTFVNNFEILPDSDQSGEAGGPGTAYMIIHEPISVKGMSNENMVHLRKQVFNTINSTLQEYERSLPDAQAGLTAKNQL